MASQCLLRRKNVKAIVGGIEVLAVGEKRHVSILVVAECASFMKLFNFYCSLIIIFSPKIDMFTDNSYI